MVKVRVRLLGISGTPIKDGNCDNLVKQALDAALEMGDVETEFVSLAGKEIQMCQHCQYCIENRTACKIKDDATPIYQMMERADGFILGGPTWDLTLAPPLLNLISRLREATFFSYRYRNKVGGGVTCGWFGWGMDAALDVIDRLMRSMQVIPVARGSAMSSAMAYGQRAAHMEHGALDDKAGLRSVRNVGLRVAEIARLIKFATESGALPPPELLVVTTGGRMKAPQKTAEKKKFVDGVWR
ncbi:MAG: flavodoxin family protein [Chloroflexota bacterium]